MILPITIDTREQRPWSWLPSEAMISVETLRTGDYAITGDDGFAIERKSLDDFLGTISSGWARFERELWRMAGWPARVVIIEADLASVYWTPDGIAPDHRHQMLTPKFIAKRIAELTMRNVSVLFAGDDERASRLALAILRERDAHRYDFNLPRL